MSAVYFVRNETTGVIKIGVSRWLNTRLGSIQNASSEPISLIGAVAGDEELEKSLHKKFAHLRIRGEWFKPDPELVRCIKFLMHDLPSPPASEEVPSANDEYTNKAIGWLTEIERGEASRNKCIEAEMRSTVAMRIGVDAGYIEALRRGRIKTPISARDFMAVKEEYIAECQRQIEEAKELLEIVLTDPIAPYLTQAREALDGGMK